MPCGPARPLGCLEGLRDCLVIVCDGQSGMGLADTQGLLPIEKGKKHGTQG